MPASAGRATGVPAPPILTVEKLSVSFRARDGAGFVEAVRGIDLHVAAGERLGLVGESGSGKSATGRAVMRLLPRNARVDAQRLDLQGRDLLAASEREMRSLRGRDLALILQDPRYSLNPVVPVGRQVAEAAQLHTQATGRRAARERALAMLAAVRIADPARVYDLYPHEISGGMGQRIMIATMLIARPKLVIADEPTSALDVSVRREILALLEELVRENGSGLLLISHDVRMVERFCDRIAIMYRGRIVETLRRLSDARHPYTRGLIDSVPSLKGGRGPLPVLDRRALALFDAETGA